MFKQLMAATAILTIASAAHAAQSATTTAADPNAPAAVTAPAAGQMFLPSAMVGDHLATKLIGASVYESSAADAQSIGNVNDIVIASDGSIEGVVVGVGGFLGIGQKNVAIPYANLSWSNRDGGPMLVAQISKDDLNNAPAFDTAALDVAPADATQPANQTAQNNAAMKTDQMAANNNAPATTPLPGTINNGVMTTTEQMAANQNGAAMQTGSKAGQPATTTQTAQQNIAVPNAGDLAQVDVATISANNLINTTVYSGANENVGEVGDVILSDDGKIDAVVLDVGGFLGLGEKPVAIAFDALDIRKDANGNLVIYTKFTKDQLEAAPDYNKDRYQGERNTMRLSNPS